MERTNLILALVFLVLIVVAVVFIAIKMIKKKKKDDEKDKSDKKEEDKTEKDKSDKKEEDKTEKDKTDSKQGDDEEKEEETSGDGEQDKKSEECVISSWKIKDGFKNKCVHTVTDEDDIKRTVYAGCYKDGAVQPHVPDEYTGNCSNDDLKPVDLPCTLSKTNRCCESVCVPDTDSSVNGLVFGVSQPDKNKWKEHLCQLNESKRSDLFNQGAEFVRAWRTSEEEQICGKATGDCTLNKNIWREMNPC